MNDEEYYYNQYSCRHGVCKRVPSCFGGVCQEREIRRERAAKTGLVGYECVVGACPMQDKCDAERLCVWDAAAQGYEDSHRKQYRDVVLKHVAGETTIEPKDDSMDQRKTNPAYSFMWGFPYETTVTASIGDSLPLRLSPEEQEIRQWSYDVGVAPPKKTETLEEMSERLSGERAQKWLDEQFHHGGGVVSSDPDFWVGTDSVLSQDSQERKDTPICTGVVDYFPRALAYVARVSKVGNDKHNPGEPLHWSKHKSTDHADCIARHLIERGEVDPDGMRHSGMLAWRALALLEMELEAEANDCTVEELIDGYAAEAE